MLSFLLLSLASTSLVSAAATSSSAAAPLPTTIPGLVSQFGLTNSFNFPQPRAALAPGNETLRYLRDGYSLNNRNVQAGREHMSFQPDPFPDSSSNANGTALKVVYNAGSYGGGGDGGCQFYAQPLNSSNPSTPFGTMMLSYDVAFDPNFAFNMGGKLPGLRGGPDSKDCSGGNETNGTSCFSTRLMWRTNGAGEVYAYIPASKSLCASNDVICNADYGTSINRGSFTLQRGVWNPLTLFVQLNNPPNIANGRLSLFLNNNLVLSRTSLVLRTSDDIASVGGLWVSTFFGGADASWASPANQSSYFRNFRLLAGTAVSDGAGAKSDAGKSGAGVRVVISGSAAVVAAFVCAFGLL